MYKVILIDDEPLVTRWLQEKIDWRVWDCEVVGVGTNGLEGKVLVDTHRPDLIISDVKMPGLNGLKLSQYIRENHPKTLVLMLSGFNEFDYVRTALRNDVFDYLLKPIDIEEFRRTMSRICDQLKQISDNDSHKELSAKKLEESSQLTETGILMSLMMNGNQELETLMVKMRRLELQIDQGQIAVYELLRMDQTEKWTAVYQYAAQNILHETFHRHHCNPTVFYIGNRCVVVSKFTMDKPISLWEKRVNVAAAEGLENAKLYLKQKLSLGLSPVFRTIADCHSSYLQAVKNLEAQIFWSNETAYAVGIHDGTVGPTYSVDSSLFEHIDNGDYPAAEAYLNSLALSLRMTGKIELVYSICIDMLIRLSKIAEKWEKDDFLPLVSDIKQYRSFDELLRSIKETVQSLCLWIEKKKTFVSASLTDKVALYVREHYADPNIHLGGVADLFHVSLSHLSRIFVKATGLSFNEYLTQVRLEHARDLMEQQHWLSNQEIAERVGFNDGRYFSQVFKKYVGKTPNEYRGKKSAL